MMMFVIEDGEFQSMDILGNKSGFKLKKMSLLAIKKSKYSSIISSYSFSKALFISLIVLPLYFSKISYKPLGIK
jgi:hypothetical protein